MSCFWELNKIGLIGWARFWRERRILILNQSKWGPNYKTGCRYLYKYPAQTALGEVLRKFARGKNNRFLHKRTKQRKLRSQELT